MMPMKRAFPFPECDVNANAAELHSINKRLRAIGSKVDTILEFDARHVPLGTVRAMEA